MENYRCLYQNDLGRKINTWYLSAPGESLSSFKSARCCLQSFLFSVVENKNEIQ
jgi:hypothetical protein